MSERGKTFDIVKRKALEIMQSPTNFGYSYLDLSAEFGFPAHSLNSEYPRAHSLKVLHSVVALPPKPYYVQHARKDIPFPLEQYHMMYTAALDTQEQEKCLALYQSVLVHLSASIMEGIDAMTTEEHESIMGRLALMGSEDPLAIYTLMASDYEEPGVFTPDSLRIYIPDGYSMALVMRDLATKARVGVSLN